MTRWPLAIRKRIAMIGLSCSTKVRSVIEIGVKILGLDHDLPVVSVENRAAQNVTQVWKRSTSTLWWSVPIRLWVNHH